MAVYSAPDWMQTVAEASAPLDWLTVLWRAPQLLAMPKGDGRPILLVPGYLTDGRAMFPLGHYLEYLGYQTYDWQGGLNMGFIDPEINHLTARVHDIHERTGSGVTLVGWSLGGTFARECAKACPGIVTEVITLGSPVVGGPKYTAAAEFYRAAYGVDLDVLEEEVARRNQRTITQPLTLVHSKRDGIVGWHASNDPYTPHVRQIEVTCSHLGMGMSAEVWQIIAETLAHRGV